jgi:hypothetical protein
MKRIVALASFTVLLLWAWQEPPNFSARVRVTIDPLLPARVYLFKSGQPHRLQPVQATIPVRSDLFYRDRLWLENPDPSVLEVIANDEYHYLLLKGQADFHLPAGKYRMEAYRGFFYEPAVVEFELKAEERREIKLPLKAWAPAGEWLSADDHIHLTRGPRENRTFLGWIAAEDLNVANFLQLQRQSDAAPQNPFASATHMRYVIRPGQETRNQSLGHILFLGAKELIRPMSTGAELANTPEDYPFHTLLFDRARAAGAVTGYAHFRERPRNSTLYMDLALGKLDFIELFQFGVLTTEPWYELLNAGFKITPLAGSDFPANIPRLKPYPRWIPLLGPERAYVKAPAGSDPYAAWARGVKEGRVLVTNGPIVEIKISGKTVTADASFWREIETLEIVRNGEVIAFAPGAGKTRATLSAELKPGENAWVAARVRAKKLEHEPDIQAHTSPLYTGGPVRIESARRALATRWSEEIARYRTKNLVFATPAQREEFYAAAERALAELNR